MKTNYSIKAALLLVIVTFCFTTLNAQANVRILKLDPATNSFTLKNFGDMNATISGYWLCNRPQYEPLNGLTSVTTLAPNEELSLGSNINFAPGDGEFALYLSSNFGSSADMLDYVQWGNGGHGRESEAVGAGLWIAGTFVSVAPPYQYTGNGTQNGVANWSTLGIDDFEKGSHINLYPNPSNSILNIQIKDSASNGMLQVFDVLGKQILTQSITSTEISKIDVTNWDNGLYLIKISSEQGEETKRFIKK